MQEDFEVEHSHARVLRQGDGSFILQSEDRATFEVLDADGGDSQKTGQVGCQVTRFTNRLGWPGPVNVPSVR